LTEHFEWQTAPPAHAGLDAERLRTLQDDLARRGTKALLVARHDRIVWEWYAEGHGPDRPHYTASLAKALVGGVSLMLAKALGRLDVDDLACHYIPAWRHDPLKSEITLRHLATHSSGIEDAEAEGLPHDRLPGWKGAFWRREPDPFTIARDQAPVLFPPGSAYAYSNPGMAMLAYAVTAALQEAPQREIRSLLRERIMQPIGVPDAEWSVGYGTTYDVDGLKLVANWGGGSFTARAVARVGRLMLRKGNWEGQQLVPAEWVEKAVAFAGTPLPDRQATVARPPENPEPASGLGWWTNFDHIWKRVPPDAFAGAGAGNQLLLVVPSLDLIVVRNGAALDDSGKSSFWGAIERYLFDPLLEAIVGPPYPPSELIRAVSFAPAGEISRAARGMPGKTRFDGSDLWPMTWADDDAQYTAYGDGYGFEPYTDEKLGLGFAKILGGPTDFQGVNIRSVTGENRGMGPAGIKANGILMVDGVLYLWGRNAGNAQLAWSTDHARTWTWSDWKLTTSFGCPTLLNFGKNYQGARDDYVYTYSPDADDAYSPADRLVLARVPRARIRDRDAYEFFQRLDPGGAPVWTAPLGHRGGVFTFPGRCYRCAVSYHPGLKRYLLCMILAGGETRFEGGFGIYEAPEPWGPWSTAFFTPRWDVGPGEACSFPTKWMSAAGTTLYLVSSGDDCFSVRKATLTVAD
jgi:CubicO group peptidase (beta-lactamase class C family)